MMKSANRAVMLLTATVLAACAPSKNDSNRMDDPNHMVIKGSETELHTVTLLKNAFTEREKDVSISLSGGGSEAGIRQIIQNTVHIANVSRRINAYEIDEARENKVNPVPVIFAVDVIAIITHPRLGIDSLSISDLGAIFSGEAKSWKQFQGPDAPIHLYGRDLQSGTHHYFKQKVLDGPYSKHMDLNKNYSDIIKKVEKDTLGIGYVSLAHLLQNGKPHKNTWAVYLYIDGSRAYSPYETRWIYEGQYPLIRPLYQYTNGAPTGLARRFIDFELSPAGQAIIAQTGFFPINDFHRHVNKKSL